MSTEQSFPYSLADLGPIRGAVAACLDALAQSNSIQRVSDRDYTLWSQDPTELADRLGWLDCPEDMRPHLAAIRSLAEDISAEKYSHVVVLGMGGSSLFPEVLASSITTSSECPELSIMDSTHPDRIQRLIDLARREKVLFIASSKSGGTIETRSQLDTFWELDSNGKNFVAITDPGSDLATIAGERGFRACFENPPDIGGRFAALSLFGLVPASIAGIEVETLLEGGARALNADGLGDSSRAVNEAPGFCLGAIMAVAEQCGRNKLTLLFEGEAAGLGAWVEQLVPESTGKQGRGLLPILDEPTRAATEYSDDRLFVSWGPVNKEYLQELVEAGHPVVCLGGEGSQDELGFEVMRWEIATAIAGALLGVNPFDQPDVGTAKSATAEVLAYGPKSTETMDVKSLLGGTQAGDYIALLAYVDSDEIFDAELSEIRAAIGSRYKVATTLGIGPRYLHSTGQFHKGGTPQGRFIQIVDVGDNDVDIPGTEFSFRRLINAQADGDLSALSDTGRPVSRTNVRELREFLS